MKKTNLLIMLFLLLIIGLIDVKANSLILTHEDDKVSYEGVSLYMKQLGNESAYCLSGLNVAAPTSGTECTLSNSLLTLEQRLIVGQMMSQSCTDGVTACYVSKELAILSYLNKDTHEQSQSQSLKTKVFTIKSNAISSYGDFSVSFVDPTSDNKISELNFVIEGEYYKSQAIKIVGSNINGQVEKEITGVSGAVIEGNDSSFVIKVPIKNVNGSIEVSLFVNAKQKPSPIAELYSCGTGVQEVAKLTNIERTATNNIKGKIIRGKIIINKLDEDGNYLSGSTIIVRGPGYSNEFTSNGSPIVVDNLDFLNYGIAETNAPAGYAVDSVEKQVALTESNSTVTIDIINKLIKINVLKINENEQPLEGAVIKLMDKDENVLNICKDSNGNTVKCEWETSNKAYRIEGISAGTYYLKEISTPKGYNVNPNKIKIVIDNYGKVKIDNKEIKNNLILVSNELTTTEISKISAVNSKELPGATLEILNSKKEKIPCIIKNDKGEKETLKECKWVSTDKSTYVLGLDAGKYYLSETIAPEGYELNTNMVEFEVKADGTTTEVEMKNELSVKVPDTLSARSALLIAISMFDIALGIGIITYVKKNKIEE